jgi:glycosyltransferase involved in cell wall biosynthesis
VLPSFNEGMGRALIEAMAAGLPVVATKVGGIPALIDHGVNGLLVPSGDAKALADALRSILEHPDMARRLGEAARQSIGARFGASYMVGAIETLYEETLREAGAC